MSILKLTNGINIPIRSITKYKRLQNGVTVLFLSDGTNMEVSNLGLDKIESLLEAATSMQSDSDTIQHNVELAVRKQQEVINTSLQDVIKTNDSIADALKSFSNSLLLMTKAVDALQLDCAQSRENHKELTKAVAYQEKELRTVVSNLTLVTNQLKEYVCA